MLNEGSNRVTSGQRGILLVLSSPSGAGKTTLCQRLIAEHEGIDYSISTTTRQPRHNEKDGVDYHFVAEARFLEMIEQDLFAEWALVHGHHYGTSKATVDRSLSAGRDLLFDIDWQGALQLKKMYPDDIAMVFVLPPSVRELARRLDSRQTDAADVVALRMSKAAEELSYFGEYHYLLLNDDLQRAYEDLCAIYRAVHLCQPRQAFRALRLLDEFKSGAGWGKKP